MANRTFQPTLLGLLKRHVQIYATITMSGTTPVLDKYIYQNGNVTVAAAPTTGSGYAVGNGEGVRSVVRTGVGKWTVTLSDPYRAYRGVELAQYYSALGNAQSVAAITVDGTATNCATNTAPGNGGVFALILCDFAGAAVDPTDADALWIRFSFNDATES